MLLEELAVLYLTFVLIFQWFCLEWFSNWHLIGQPIIVSQSFRNLSLVYLQKTSDHIQLFLSEEWVLYQLPKKNSLLVAHLNVFLRRWKLRVDAWAGKFKNLPRLLVTFIQSFENRAGLVKSTRGAFFVKRGSTLLLLVNFGSASDFLGIFTPFDGLNWPNLLGGTSTGGAIRPALVNISLLRSSTNCLYMKSTNCSDWWTVPKL